MLRADPVGVVLRTDDPLVQYTTLELRQLADREWFQLPEGTDPLWRAYWSGTEPDGPLRHGPVVRTVHECLQAVLWNGTIGLAPLGHDLPAGLRSVPLIDKPPSRIVLAWNKANINPIISSFTHIAAEIFR